MKETRKRKLGELYMREVSMMLLKEIKDPRIGFVTITSCEITNDLAFAKVKFSVLGDDKVLSLAFHGLRSAAKHMQGEIARRLRLRSTPTLVFDFDPGVQKSIRVMQLLSQEYDGEQPDSQLPFVSSVIPGDDDDESDTIVSDGAGDADGEDGAGAEADEDEDDGDEEDDADDDES